MLASSLLSLLRSQRIFNFTVLSSLIREHKLITIPKTNSIRFIGDKFDPYAIIEPAKIAQEAATKKVPKKTTPVQRITLLNPNNSLTVTTLDSATKIAESKSLRLVKIVDLDVRSQRPVYKLMTEAQYLEEDLAEKKRKKGSKKETIKGEKIIIISSRIAENDFKLKVNRVQKWIDKKYEVRVTISGPSDNLEEQEKMFTEFEKLFAGKARVLQKRYKGTDIRFQLLAPKEMLSSTAESESKEKTEKKIIENVPGENISSEPSKS